MLEKIKKPNDVKKIPANRLPELADEIRQFMISSVSRTGGHLASNLGAVELTIALHYVLNLPKDKILWDVGHQSYTHKILTGRMDRFSTLRQEGGLSGFPRREESSCDSWDAGHSSNSISAALGYARARDLRRQQYTVVSVIGDGALTGGMAYEALDNAAQLKTNFIIVLNDNNMSISGNVGGMHDYLATLRTSHAYTDLKEQVAGKLEKLHGGDEVIERIRKTKNSIKQLVIPGMLFENMGLTYLGPVDGHNISAMIRLFEDAKRINGPVIVHVKTEKGHGYAPAVRHPSRFHGTGAFDVATGIPESRGAVTWTDIFSTVMVKMGERNPDVVAVTAAMKEGTGLKRFANRFPDRFFDVGIAEEHGVTFSAGLALGGLIPVFAVYSSFLQRGFDQIMNDVCMQNLHVVFAIDRGGLVGADGKTHQGVFDLSYLTMLPGMTVMAPKGAAYSGLMECREEIVLGKGEVLRKGKKIALLAVGSMVAEAVAVAQRLEADGWNPTVVNMRFVKPLDRELLRELACDHDLFVTMEENVRCGGFGEQVLDEMKSLPEEDPVHVEIIAIPDTYIHHAGRDSQLRTAGIDAETVYQRICEIL